MISKNISKAIFTLVIIILFMLPNFAMGLKNQVYNESLEGKNILHNPEPRLIIKKITGGIGLNIVIKNEGFTNITDITLNLSSSGGLISIISKKQYKIQLLNSNESKRIHTRLFGFCFGITKKYCIVTINVSSPFTNSFESKVSTKVFGPIINIVAVNYNTQKISEGYTLFTPEMSRKIYLIDNDGNVVHEWRSRHIQGLGTYLLENGNVLRSDAAGFNLDWMVRGETGRVEMYNWNGTQLWDLLYIGKTYCLHNDIEPLPNGNVLLIVWSKKTKEEAIAAGCNPNDPRLIKRGELWTDTIIEVEQDGYEGINIIWKWDVWDHLVQEFDPTKDNYGVVADHPELFNINFRGLEGVGLDLSITHLNSVDYNEDLDQILVSSRFLSEIFVIDHSTTKEEAASHSGGRYGKGGDLLYRWGNPQVYQNGDKNDQKLFLQHDAQWVKKGYPGEGYITIYNNGVCRPDGNYSSVEEIIPPIDVSGNYTYVPGSAYGPEEPIWSYRADNPTDMFSNVMSSAQRLPNGNTLICSSAQGLFIEVTPEKDIVWEYRNSVSNPLFTRVFKIQRYTPDYPGIGLLDNL